MFFCARSDYFKALVRDPLGEKPGKQQVDNQAEPTASTSTEEPEIAVIELKHLTPSVFLYILQYVYQESVEVRFDIHFFTTIFKWTNDDEGGVRSEIDIDCKTASRRRAVR